MDTHAPLSTREYLVPIRNHTEALISGMHSFNGFLYRYCKGICNTCKYTASGGFPLGDAVGTTANVERRYRLRVDFASITCVT